MACRKMECLGLDPVINSWGYVPRGTSIIVQVQHMLLTTFGVHSNPPFNTVKLTLFKVIIFHENSYVLPSGDSSGLSHRINDPTEGITLVLVGVHFRNQLVWV